MNTIDYESFIENGAIISSSEGKILIGYGERDWVESPGENSPDPYFYFPDFFLQNKAPWFRHEHWRELPVSDAADQLNLIMDRKNPLEWENPFSELFNLAFVELKESFLQQKLLKAVPYIFEQAVAKMTPERLLNSLSSVLHFSNHQPLYTYGFWNSNEGILGATPELLFRKMNSETIQTVACAGTKKSDCSSKTLMEDEKELYEHTLVIEGIKQAFSNKATLEVGQQEILRIAPISHLVTPINIRLNEPLDYQTLVSILHPTPALGAYPKEEGMRWLFDYQTLIERKRFGAPAGFVHNFESVCYVAIRNAQWNNKEELISIGAGCGVVPGSTLENEWREIQLKLAATKEILAL